MIIDFFSPNWGHFLNNHLSPLRRLTSMSEIIALLGAVSILTVAVMDAIRLTLGQIFSFMDGF